MSPSQSVRERALNSPIASFLRTETGGAAVLLAAAVAALVWANAGGDSYSSVWHADLSIRLGDWSIGSDLRHWVNDGLMAVFFFVIGLEVRRELDLGDLRERQRILLPALVAVVGMVVPVGIYLLFNAGETSAGGWGVAMSSDTALMLGVLAVWGSRAVRLRAFMVAVIVVDDLIALVVIAAVYSESISLTPLVVAGALYVFAVAIRYANVHNGFVYAVIAIAMWIAMRSSGVDPVVVGLLFGLLAFAAPAARGDLERASEIFRMFREQPTPGLAREVHAGVQAAVSPNDRLQLRFHPWSSYLIVPLFALANFGVPLGGGVLGDAFSSSLAVGIVIAYVAGKPLGILLASLMATRMRFKLPVGWGAMAAGSAAAGVGFTVSLLIATRAFEGPELLQVKLAILAAAIGSFLLSGLVFGILRLLPRNLRLRLVIGEAETLVDLAVPVDDAFDHARGPHDATVTLVEYGDYECPYCGQAESTVRELLAEHGELRYVWRHLPLSDVHPQAQLAAEAAEAAGTQGEFWAMHTLLMKNQDALNPEDLARYASELNLDLRRFERDLRARRQTGRVARDVEGAELSGVSGTPSFFINGRRHHGEYDLPSLAAAVESAGARALVRGS